MEHILFAFFIDTGRGVFPTAAINQEFPTREDCLVAKDELIKQMDGQWDRARVWCQAKRTFPEVRYPAKSDDKCEFEK